PRRREHEQRRLAVGRLELCTGEVPRQDDVLLEPPLANPASQLRLVWPVADDHHRHPPLLENTWKRVDDVEDAFLSNQTADEQQAWVLCGRRRRAAAGEDAHVGILDGEHRWPAAKLVPLALLLG